MIQSLRRGLAILEAVAAKGTGVPLAAVCREAGLHRSTAHHLLRTLAALGYVAQDEDSRAYRLGPAVYRLASASWSEGQLAEIAVPVLRELVRKTGETANLAVRRGDEAVLVETLDGGGTLRVVDRVGAARPIHCSAIGKALLAWAPADERETVLRRLKLVRYAPATITSRERLRRELARTRAAGYALDEEEMSPGVCCVAAPVFAFSGGPVAAVGIAGPAARVSREALLRYARVLVPAVRALSQRLGAGGGRS
jgi:IclR family acetate operon transcriptional repressor